MKGDAAARQRTGAGPDRAADGRLGYVVGAFSHRGRRANNEDSLLTLQCGDGLLLAVADGMGGYAAGDVASLVATSGLAARAAGILERSLSVPRAELQRLLQEVNAAVVAQAARTPDASDMGTTLLAAFVQDATFRLAHVGDSRGYLIREGRITRLTRDHTAREEALSRGASPAEADRLPHGKALTRSLGQCETVEADVWPEDPAGQTAKEGDVLLLCTDGLWGSVDEQDLLGQVEHSEDVEAACRRLGALAYERGARDNISVILCRFTGIGRQPQSLPDQASDRRATASAGPSARTSRRGNRALRLLFSLLLTLLLGLIAGFVYVLWSTGRLDLRPWVAQPGSGDQVQLLGSHGESSLRS